MTNNKRLTDGDLLAITERTGKATPGEWYYEIDGDLYSTETSEPIMRAVEDSSGIIYVNINEDDKAFIAHAREDIPKILTEIDRLCIENEGMRNVIRNIDALIDEHRLVNSRSADGMADEIIELISELERKVGEMI